MSPNKKMISTISRAYENGVVQQACVFFFEAENIVEAVEDSEESDEDILDYMESLSEGDCWSSSDDNQAEFHVTVLCLSSPCFPAAISHH